MGMGKSSSTTAAQMLAATPTPATAKQAATPEANAAESENKARAKGIQSTYYRNMIAGQSTQTKQTLGA